jgi:metal-responsive CopG/Arc/MetJ family transcriptional regulator
MNQRATKTVTVTLPPAMVDELDRVRLREHRTRSELLREALRHYMEAGSRHTMPSENAQADELEAMRQGHQDLERGETVSLEDLQNELGLPTR